METTRRRRAVCIFISDRRLQLKSSRIHSSSSASNASRERSGVNGRKISRSASAVNAISSSAECLAIQKRHCATLLGWQTVLRSIKDLASDDWQQGRAQRLGQAATWRRNISFSYWPTGSVSEDRLRHGSFFRPFSYNLIKCFCAWESIS